MVSERERRAEERGATWAGEVVRLGDAKGPLYLELSPTERLAAFIELNRRAWLATGEDWPPPLPRSQWPGEVLDLRNR